MESGANLLSAKSITLPPLVRHLVISVDRPSSLRWPDNDRDLDDGQIVGDEQNWHAHILPTGMQRRKSEKEEFNRALRLYFKGWLALRAHHEPFGELSCVLIRKIIERYHNLSTVTVEMRRSNLEALMDELRWEDQPAQGFQIR